MKTLYKIFAVALVLNLIWEFSHCRLYVTCVEIEAPELLLITMALKDALWICVFYLISRRSKHQYWLLGLLGLLFAFIVESISIGIGRWEYGVAMPLVFGVGLSPLLQLAVTGVLTSFIGKIKWRD